MKKPDITAGHWEAQTLSDDHNGYEWPTFTIRSKPANYCIAVVGDVDRATAENNEANARLIAALPKLLEALEQLKAIGDAGVAMRHETGKPTWSALEETRRITREALTAAGYTE